MRAPSSSRSPSTWYVPARHRQVSAPRHQANRSELRRWMLQVGIDRAQELPARGLPAPMMALARRVRSSAYDRTLGYCAASPKASCQFGRAVVIDHDELVAVCQYRVERVRQTRTSCSMLSASLYVGMTTDSDKGSPSSGSGGQRSMHLGSRMRPWQLRICTGAC